MFEILFVKDVENEFIRRNVIEIYIYSLDILWFLIFSFILLFGDRICCIIMLRLYFVCYVIYDFL